MDAGMVQYSSTVLGGVCTYKIFLDEWAFFTRWGFWRVDQLRGWDIRSSLQTRTFRFIIRLGCRRRPSLYPSIASVVRFLLGSSHVRGNCGPNLCFSAGRH